MPPKPGVKIPAASRQQASEVQAYKAKCLKIIQKYLDPISSEVGKETVLSDISQLTLSHYDDLVEERSLADLCGYVFCDLPLSESKENASFTKDQIYKIVNNALYDIKRRKMFCSNVCFKRSDHLRKQFSSDILQVLKKPSKLILSEDTSGEFGDEIVLQKRITVDEIENPEGNTDEATKEKREKKPKNVLMNQTTREVIKQEARIESKISAPYVRDDVFKELKEKFSGLAIKERNLDEFEKFMDQLAEDPQKAIEEYKEQKKDKAKEVPQEIELKESEVRSTTINERKVDLSEQFKTLNLKDQSPCSKDLDNISVVSSYASSTKSAKARRRMLLEIFDQIKSWTTTRTREHLRLDESLSYSSSGEEFDAEKEDEESELEARLDMRRKQYAAICAMLDQEENEWEAELEADRRERLRKNKSNSNQQSPSITTEKTRNPKKNVKFLDPVPEDSEIGTSDKKAEKEDAENEESKDEPIFLPFNFQPLEQRIRSLLRQIHNIMLDFFDGNMDVAERQILEDELEALIRTFGFAQHDLRFYLDNAKLNGVVIIILVALLQYGRIDPARYESNFQKNIVINKFLKRHSSSLDNVRQNLRRIWGEPRPYIPSDYEEDDE